MRQPAAALSASMPSSEFTYWMAYLREYPDQDNVTNYMIAQLTALVANLMRGKDSNPFSVDDFIPKRHVKETNWRVVLEQAKQAFGGYGE